jgi:hypothetical protein
VDLSRRLPRVMECYKVSGSQRFLSDRIRVIVLPVIMSRHETYLSKYMTDFSHGMMLTKSNTNPLPSELRAHTGWENG